MLAFEHACCNFQTKIPIQTQEIYNDTNIILVVCSMLGNIAIFPYILELPRILRRKRSDAPLSVSVPLLL